MGVPPLIKTRRLAPRQALYAIFSPPVMAVEIPPPLLTGEVMPGLAMSGITSRACLQFSG